MHFLQLGAILKISHDRNKELFSYLEFISYFFKQVTGEKGEVSAGELKIKGEED